MVESRHVVMLVRNPYTNDTRVEKEARALIGAGYRVTIVADAGPGLPMDEDRDGSRVVRVPRSGPALPGLRYAWHELTLLRVLRSLRPAVLHAHDTNALFPVAMTARRLRVPFVYDAHDLWLGRPRRERSRLYFALNQAVYRLVETLFVPRAAAVLTVSAPIAKHLARVYRLTAVDLVPNYPDFDGDVLARDLRDLPDAAGLVPELPIVLYLGGLMGGRGLEELVDAMPAIGDAQLVLLGGGYLGPSLKRRADAIGAGERVHLLSPVPSDQVVAYAASAQIGVSPIVPSCLNYRYSLPNKLFQYMAAALPVVASDFPQVRDIVEGAACGALVDARRPDDIALAVNRILADGDAARAMGSRGRNAINERYNWGVSAAALLEVYARLPV
jgi:glycosyltransferase involved in cell wall biosynthesis